MKNEPKWMLVSGAHYLADEYGATFQAMCYCSGECDCSPNLSLDELEEVVDTIKRLQDNQN